MIKTSEKNEVQLLLTRNWAVVHSWFTALKKTYTDMGNLEGLRRLNTVYLGLLVSAKSRKLSSNQVRLVRQIVTDLQESLTRELAEFDKVMETKEEDKAE